MKDGHAEPWTSTLATLVEGIFELRSQQWQASQEALVVKNPPASAGDVRDTGSVPGLGRSPGVGNDNPLQYSYLENSMDRGSLAGYSPWGLQRVGHH